MEIRFELYVWCFLAFLLGQGIQLFWIKIPSLRQRSAAVNKPFLFKDWIACDWNILVGTQLFGFLLLLVMNEVLNWKPEYADFIKTIWGLLGAFGTSVALSKWGQFEKGIINFIDVKANISDLVTGPTKHIGEVIQKGNEATGKDVTQAPL
jgi:hypothetical protein